MRCLKTMIVCLSKEWGRAFSSQLRNSQFQGTDMMDWLDAATVCHCCTAMGHSCVL